MNKMSDGDFQKLLQIALQSLSIQRTLMENRVAELHQELRTLERDDELETLDQQLLLVQKDYEHYQTYIDNANNFNLDKYYE